MRTALTRPAGDLPRPNGGRVARRARGTSRATGTGRSATHGSCWMGGGSSSRASHLAAHRTASSKTRSSRSSRATSTKTDLSAQPLHRSDAAYRFGCNDEEQHGHSPTRRQTPGGDATTGMSAPPSTCWPASAHCASTAHRTRTRWRSPRSGAPRFPPAGQTRPGLCGPSGPPQPSPPAVAPRSPTSADGHVRDDDFDR